MTTAAEIQHLQEHGLYSAADEHDACGVGFVAHIKGEKSHNIVQQALKILENLDHRGAVGADKLMGDGAGILIQLPDALYRDEMAKQGVTLPPLGRSVLSLIVPLPDAVHVPPPAPTQVQVQVSLAGKVSATVAPVALLGPAFEAVMV